MQKNLFVVRKSEPTHGNPRAEGKLGKSWIFFDDFMSLGGTLRECQATVQHVQTTYRTWYDFSTVMLGTYEYSYRRWFFNQEVAPFDWVKDRYIDRSNLRGAPVPCMLGALAIPA